jgi:hypothetical protein
VIHEGQALEIVLHTLFRTLALFLDDRAHVRQPHVSQEANIETFPIIGFHTDLSQEVADPRGVLASSEQEVTSACSCMYSRIDVHSSSHIECVRIPYLFRVL